jgi:uncharacterized phage infection (PIP) family protein YhgE
MRRAIFLALGVLELAAAVLLVVMGFVLPGPRAVRENFNRVAQVTESSRQQVESVHNEMGTIRDERLQKFLAELQPHLPRLKERLEGDVNLEGVRQVNASLGNLATAMEEWANALDPALVEELSTGAGRLATFLDGSVADAASKAADRLEKTTDTLRKDAEVLSRLLRDAPPDLRAARDIYESLGRFDEGLEKVSILIEPARLKSMREGFKGMESSLESGADQVGRLAGYTYPMVKLNGFRPPEVEEKPFWPEGRKIAAGMRMGAKAIKAAGKELDAQSANLPNLQKALEESRKAVSRTRDTLGKALKDQDKLETVLKTIPENTARLAQELPLLTSDVVRVLRETERLKDVAASIRETRTKMAEAVARLPRARKGLYESAARIRRLKERLDAALNDPQGYQQTIQQTIQLTDSAANIIPLLANRLSHLETQQKGLAELGTSLGEVHDALPVMADNTVTILTLLRWMLWVGAALMAVHGLAQIVTSWKRAPAGARA